MAQGAAEGIYQGIGQGLDTVADTIRSNKQNQSLIRDQQADQLTEQIKSIADNIARVGGKDKPEAAPLIEQLNATVQKHNALFPPHESGALIQRIQKMMGHKPGAPRPDVRAGMTPEAAMATSPRPAYSTTRAGQMEQAGTNRDIYQGQSDLEEKIRQEHNDRTVAKARELGLDEETIKQLVATQAGVPAGLLKPPPEHSGNFDTIEGKLADGTPFSYQRSKFDGHVVDMAGNKLDPSVLNGFVVSPKSAAVKNKQAWIMRDGKPLSVMLDANNHMVPGTENPDAVPPPSLFGRMSSTSVYMDDGFGNIIELPKTTISGPIGTSPSAPPSAAPGVASGTPVASSAPRAGLPQTPAEARQMLPPPGGRTVAPKASKPYLAAKADVDKAAGIVELAKAAAVKKSALSDRNLAIRMAREASGRFSMAEYDTMIKNAGLGSTFEQWMNNISGGQLPDNVRNQLIAVANDNLAAAQAELKSSGGGPPTGGSPSPTAGGKDPLGLGL